MDSGYVRTTDRRREYSRVEHRFRHEISVNCRRPVTRTLLGNSNKTSSGNFDGLTFVIVGRWMIEKLLRFAVSYLRALQREKRSTTRSRAVFSAPAHQTTTSLLACI